MSPTANHGKKIEVLILTLDGREIWLNMKGPEVLLVIDGMKTAGFKRFSPVLSYLIQHRNEFISGASMRDLASPDSVSDCIYEIRKIFKDCGLTAPIEAVGKGSSYQVCFRTIEETAVYGEEYEEFPEDISGSGMPLFPPADKFTGGQKILSDYLPQCQTDVHRHTTLSSFVFLDFLRQPSSGRLLVSSIGGGGKTFSLCHTYQQAAERNIPAFYVRADMLEDAEGNLLHYIARTWLRAPAAASDQDALDRFLRSADRPLLILVDGLNECSAQKLSFCCTSFLQMQKQAPEQIKGIFTTRFPQTVKARLPHALEAKLLPLSPLKFSPEGQKLLSRLHVEATPLIRKLLESMDASRLDTIQSRHALYTIYFDALTEQADLERGDGWIYSVLSCVAARSLAGETINNRWLKTLCSDAGDAEGDGFIHQWAGSEEYPLETPAAAEKLKATGFLIKVDFDRYVIHQQFRDCLAVRYAMLQLSCGVLSAEEFADRLLDATRYYTAAPSESASSVNLRRHNNMDLGEFGFYALLKWYESHPQNHVLALKLARLGIQVAYLFDNVQNRHGLYALHCCLEGLLDHCFRHNSADAQLLRSLPGYCFCLNKLVAFGHGISALSSSGQLLDFSRGIESYYKIWTRHMTALLPAKAAGGSGPSSEAEELKAVGESGLGGVYLARWKIAETYDLKIECLSQAISHHTAAMELRRSISSPKLYLSYSALGTTNYYKASTYLKKPGGGLIAEAVNLFEISAKYHQMALEQESHREKHVSYTRLAGCFYELYQLASIRENTEDMLRSQDLLYSAVRESCRSLSLSAEADGAVRHGSEIHALLTDLNRYAKCLPLDDTDIQAFDLLCRLYHQACPYEKAPYFDRSSLRVIFA